MNLKFVIDTSAYSAFNRDQHNMDRFIAPASEVFVPLIVIGELRAGFRYGGRWRDNESLLDAFLNLPNVTLLWLSEKTTKSYAGIYTQLRSINKPIGTNDMWVAALCLEHNLSLLTLDPHFNRVKGLDLIPV